MARVERDPTFLEDSRDRRPDPSVMLRERMLARVVERDPRVRPGKGEVRRGVDRSRSTADDVDGLGGCQLVVRCPESRIDVLVGLQVRPAPEAVGDTGRDDQHVVRLGAGAAVREPHADHAVGERELGERAVDRAYAVQLAVAVEPDVVLAGPPVGSGQPHAQLLPADEGGLGRDADDVDVSGQVPGREQAGVAEARDHHPGSAHDLTRGGRGTSRGTRSITSWYAGRRSRLRCSIIGMLAPRKSPAIAMVPMKTHHQSAGDAARPNRPRANQKLISPK